MSRTGSRSQAIALLFIAFALVPLAPGSASTRSSSITADNDEIHWTILGLGAVSVDWRGPSNTLRYGLTPTYVRTIVAHSPNPTPVSSSGPFWQAELMGLNPNTVYHYAIGNGADHTFRTAPMPGTSDFTFCVEADVGSSLSHRYVAPVQALIAQQQPRFSIVAGDLSYGDEDGPAAVDQHFNDVMVWSTDAAYMPAWGNHEWQTGKQTDPFANYKGRFELPHPQLSPGSPQCCGSDWYWFDYGNVRFIAYPEPWPGAMDAWIGAAWAIMNDAQNNPAISAIVTFGHRPTYTTGAHPAAAKLKQFLDSLGVAHSKYVLDLSGHCHDYERTKPQSGVTHLVVGIGGAGLDAVKGPCAWPTGCPPPGWIAYRAMHHGTLVVTVHADRIEGAALCGPASGVDDMTCTEGATFDQFTIPLNGQPLPAHDLRARITPTPAVASSELEFSTEQRGWARVSLFDPAGRLVESVMNDPALPAGRHEFPLTLGDRGLRPGIYLYRIETSEGSASARLVLLK